MLRFTYPLTIPSSIGEIGIIVGPKGFIKVIENEKIEIRNIKITIKLFFMILPPL
jgi:hypothetical protein